MVKLLTLKERFLEDKPSPFIALISIHRQFSKPKKKPTKQSKKNKKEKNCPGVCHG